MLEVNFAGFHITEGHVRPLPQYLDSIRDFPQPQKIGDIRSWFGLVNQVAHYGRLVSIMDPFTKLLSPKTPFMWTSELEDSFQASKTEIINAIKEGVKIFDPRRRTCLSPDWSKVGIGYWLRQKHCSCDSLTPDCCTNGWKITLTGSRFLRSAEKRYAPVEGRSLALAWALEDTKFITMGCLDLIIATDHKPLVKIFGDRALDEITNERILRLKQRTLRWCFQVVHVSGKNIPASDAASRYPCRDDLSALRVEGDLDDMESSIVASKSCYEKVISVTWDRVKRATCDDPDLSIFSAAIESDFSGQIDEFPEIHCFWPQRNELTIVDGVVLFGSRVVPQALQPSVCKSLHSEPKGQERSLLARYI